TARRIAVAVALVAALAVGGVTAAAVDEPLDRNAAYTEKYETVYEPIESADFENALVFIPDPYGPWQNHPFQSLRNDPGFDGEAVYARDRDAAGDFEVLAAYPNRSTYRFAYRGEWTPEPDQFVTPKLEPLSTPAGESLTAETRVGVADRVQRATVDIVVDGETVTHAVDSPGESITANWTLSNDTARLVAVDDDPLVTPNGSESANESSATTASVPIDATEEVTVRITLVDPGGNTYTYEQVAAVQTTDGEIQAVTPPERRVCRLTTDCDPDETYLPDDPTAHPEWVEFETEIQG
ncbi:MAG: hypothetical protein ACOCPZ_04165, partial [Natrialbaceae archaeon]